MANVRQYEVHGYLETDGGATEEWPGPDDLVVYASDYGELEAERDKWRRRATEAEQSPYSQTLRRADDHISDLHRERDDLRAKLATAREALEQAGRDICGCGCALDHPKDPHCLAHRDVMAALAAIKEE